MNQLSGEKKIKIVDLGLIDYEEALLIQERLLKLRQEDRIDDTLLLLEHEPVITIGKRGNSSNILAPKEFLAEQGVKVCSIGRGGDVTYHGPGQIVGYPIMRFLNHVPGIKELVRALEEVFIQLLNKYYQIAAGPIPEYPGVWVGNDKITAIGLSIHSGVTMHGFAFNVNTDLTAFQWILSCGITGKGVTSIKKLTDKKQDIAIVKKQVIQCFGEVFRLKPYWEDKTTLLQSMELLE
ncbi:MAG: lipoyl(octanoyl) transferase LipB [Atribacterota bacterium]|jgi:lipoyl(octanoyl) transferase|nr:lipoyl(octanoyl) transferase LipB [Atribacterota bacterium]MDD4896459.1 lipoyl(octanoyl) transferase LipB [Atribacterota bacterium]MDD5636873.1 lipoyl(octanoyl) transferase LipB [Atribacterota bacterium]